MFFFLRDRRSQSQVTEYNPILMSGVVNVNLKQGDLANPNLDAVLVPTLLLRFPAVDQHSVILSRSYQASSSGFIFENHVSNHDNYPSRTDDSHYYGCQLLPGGKLQFPFSITFNLPVEEYLYIFRQLLNRSG